MLKYHLITLILLVGGCSTDPDIVCENWSVEERTYMAGIGGLVTRPVKKCNKWIVRPAPSQ
jgi:hypothetical protein